MQKKLRIMKTKIEREKIELILFSYYISSSQKKKKPGGCGC